MLWWNGASSIVNLIHFTQVRLSVDKPNDKKIKPRWLSCRINIYWHADKYGRKWRHKVKPVLSKLVSSCQQSPFSLKIECSVNHTEAIWIISVSSILLSDFSRGAYLKLSKSTLIKTSRLFSSWKEVGSKRKQCVNLPLSQPHRVPCRWPVIRSGMSSRLSFGLHTCTLVLMEHVPCKWQRKKKC